MEHEIDASEHLGEYIESVENKFRPTAPKVVPPWARKQPWRVWTPMLTEYYNIIDNPRRVPSILQPLISKERAFTFGQGKPSYLNFKIYPPDEHGVHRRLYINLCQENLIVGALGAVLVGLGTKHFHLSQNRFHSFLAKRLLLGNPVATATKLAFTGSIGTLSVATKLLARASIGAVMYDTLTRSQEELHMSKGKKLMNVGMAGGICGLIFGLRGGLPHAWVGALAFSAGAMASEFMDIPTVFPTNID